MVTDESRIALKSNDSVRVWREQRTNYGTRSSPDITQSAGSIMVWEGISLEYNTDLFYWRRFVTVIQYRDEVSDSTVKLPSALLMDFLSL